jgi:hypothetical protein
MGDTGGGIPRPIPGGGDRPRTRSPSRDRVLGFVRTNGAGRVVTSPPAGPRWSSEGRDLLVQRTEDDLEVEAGGRSRADRGPELDEAQERLGRHQASYELAHLG